MEKSNLPKTKQLGNQVKHLLILISLILLSSPVIGNSHKGETLYGWGEYPDYKWRGFGDKEFHPVYKGDVKNGKPNGLGIMIYPRLGLRVKFFTGYYYFKKYIGSWKNGKEWNGKGYDPKGYYLLKFVNGERMKK